MKIRTRCQRCGRFKGCKRLGVYWYCVKCYKNDTDIIKKVQK